MEESKSYGLEWQGGGGKDKRPFLGELTNLS